MARGLWYGLNVLLLAAALLRLDHWRGLRPLSSSWCLLILLGLTFGPVILTLYLAQVNFILLVLLVEAMICFSRRRDAVGGLLLGLAAGVKVFPAALILYLLWRGRWQAAAAALAGVALTIGLAMVVPGPGPSLAYARGTRGGAGELLPGIPFNQSVYALFARVEAQTGRAAWGAAGVAATGIVAPATALAGRRHGRWRPEPEMSLAISAVLLTTPISWLHYEVLLLPIVALALFPASGESRQSGSGDRLVAFMT